MKIKLSKPNDFFNNGKAGRMWDQRFGPPESVYDTEPHDFLRQLSDRIVPGRVLCLAEGEGRNAVFLAQRDCSVRAVDASARGSA